MSRTFPHAYNEDDCCTVFIPVAFIPIIAGKIAELEQKHQWATDDDWRHGYQATLELQRCFVACGQITGLIKDLSVLLAKAHSLDYSEALEASMPQLASALYDAEQADTTNTLDSIYRHATGQTEQTTAIEGSLDTAVKVLLSLLGDKTLPVSTILTAYNILKGGGGTAEILIQTIIDKSLGARQNQAENYLAQLNNLIGGPGTAEPVE